MKSLKEDLLIIIYLIRNVFIVSSNLIIYSTTIYTVVYKLLINYN